MPVCAQAVLDVASSSCFRPQLHRLEPVHVLPVEEHEPHRADPLVHMEGMPGENCPFHHNPVGIRGEKRARGKQGLPTIRQFLENKDGGWREANRGEGGHDDLTLAEPPLVLVLVAVCVLGEGGAGGEPPPATLEHQPRLGLDRSLPCQGAFPHDHVEDRHPVLMGQEGGEDQVGGGLSGQQVRTNARNKDRHISSNLSRMMMMIGGSVSAIGRRRI